MPTHARKIMKSPVQTGGMKSKMWPKVSESSVVFSFSCLVAPHYMCLLTKDTPGLQPAPRGQIEFNMQRFYLSEAADNWSGDVSPGLRIRLGAFESQQCSPCHLSVLRGVSGDQDVNTLCKPFNAAQMRSLTSIPAKVVALDSMDPMRRNLEEQNRLRDD